MLEVTLLMLEESQLDEDHRAGEEHSKFGEFSFTKLACFAKHLRIVLIAPLSLRLFGFMIFLLMFIIFNF